MTYSTSDDLAAAVMKKRVTQAIEALDLSHLMPPSFVPDLELETFYGNICTVYQFSLAIWQKMMDEKPERLNLPFLGRLVRDYGKFLSEGFPSSKTSNVYKNLMDLTDPEPGPPYSLDLVQMEGDVFQAYESPVTRPEDHQAITLDLLTHVFRCALRYRHMVYKDQSGESYREPLTGFRDALGQLTHVCRTYLEAYVRQGQK